MYEKPVFSHGKKETITQSTFIQQKNEKQHTSHLKQLKNSLVIYFPSCQ